MNYFNQTELNFKRIRSEGFCLANVFVIMKTFLVLKHKKFKISKLFMEKEIEFIANTMSW